MQVVLSWSAVPNSLYYNVYRSVVSGGPYQLVAQSNPASGIAASSYTDGPGTLDNGQDYFYVVSAVTVDGESPYSAEYHAVAPAAPGSPTGVTAVIT